MERSNSKQSEVAIIKSQSPIEGVSNGIEMLGGISRHVKDGDQVFIKFNLILSEGFPTNTNFDTLGAVIKSCIEARAKKYTLEAFQPWELRSRKFRMILELKVISNL